MLSPRVGNGSDLNMLPSGFYGLLHFKIRELQQQHSGEERKGWRGLNGKAEQGGADSADT